MLQLLSILFRLYEVIVIIRVLFSWIRVDEYNPAVRWVNRLTEPLLEPIRRILPTVMGIDFSPLVLLLALSLLQRFIMGMF